MIILLLVCDYFCIRLYKADMQVLQNYSVNTNISHLLN